MFSPLMKNNLIDFVLFSWECFITTKSFSSSISSYRIFKSTTDITSWTFSNVRLIRNINIRTASKSWTVLTFFEDWKYSFLTFNRIFFTICQWEKESLLSEIVSIITIITTTTFSWLPYHWCKPTNFFTKISLN
jgi:hypothetical protein